MQLALVFALALVLSLEHEEILELLLAHAHALAHVVVLGLARPPDLLFHHPQYRADVVVGGRC
jgi:hypothetical protein